MSSDNYAGRLSEYKNKGVCGLPELQETKRSLDAKVQKLISMIEHANHIVVLTGAGVSTGAGINDFRGPQGIWTAEEKEKKKKKAASRTSKKRKLDQHKQEDQIERNDDGNAAATTCESSAPPGQITSFSNAKPTLTHRAVTKLTLLSKIKYTITQNVDGLHMRSGMPRSNHCFLHGCIFTEKCEVCQKEYFRDFDVGGVSFKKTGRVCDAKLEGEASKPCGGCLRDTILDWEDALPEDDWVRAQEECEKSDLILALGTSLRIEPAGSLPTLGRKFVIINKQVTPYDRHPKVALAIRANVDHIFDRVMSTLDIVDKDWDTNDDD